MKKYHVNPVTGVANHCTAVFRCRFGVSEENHYATREEAQKAFEADMESEIIEETLRKSKKLGPPILLAPTSLTMPSTDAKYEIEYDYDWSNGGCECEDICRCSTITNVQLTGWKDNNPDGLANYARIKLSMKAGAAIPEDLKKKLEPYADFEMIAHDFEVNIVNGYYGEELDSIKAPQGLTKVLNQYYYSQNNAVGHYSVLPYLRGKGYDTTGESPLTAIKGALRAENGGRLNKKVENAKSFKVVKIGLKNIKKLSKSQEAAAVKDQRKPLPVKETGMREEIAGVAFKNETGEYELVDGYHRTAYYENQTKRQKVSYIVLSGDYNLPPASRLYGYDSPGNYGWSQE